MSKKLLTLTICILMLAQTTMVVSDVHELGQPGSQSVESKVQNGDVDLDDSSYNADSSKHDCHHCGHCHGHAHSAIPSKVMVFNARKLENSIVSNFRGEPSRFASLLFRPPIA